MTNPDHQVWAAVLSHLRAHHPTLCRQWFDQLEPASVNGGVLYIRAHSRLHSEYLQRECLGAFNEALQVTSGRLMGVRFVGPGEENGSISPVAAPGRAQESVPGSDAALRGDGLVLNPDYGFENFVLGPGNQLAHAASVAVAANPGRSYNPLFIHGSFGLGKTHLLQAVCLRILECAPTAVLYYISCEAFVNQFMAAVQAGQMSHFRHKFRDVDVLVIDDIHFLAKLDRSQEEFFHTFNSLYQASKQIILSSDAPPEQIPDLEERLISRFKWGLVAEVEPPCYETRVAIIKRKARLRGVEIQDDICCYIANRIDTNIRELEGAITKLQIRSAVEGRPIDLELAKKAIGEPAERTNGSLTIQVITEVVTEFYGVRLSELLSKKRARSIALPRQVCMYFARSKTRHSLEEIGLFFGGRDHTTVMHALKAVEERRREQPELDSTLMLLEQRLTAR